MPYPLGHGGGWQKRSNLLYIYNYFSNFAPLHFRFLQYVPLYLDIILKIILEKNSLAVGIVKRDITLIVFYSIHQALWLPR